MPIITPRLILRPPTLADLDQMQAAKEEIWDDLQLWMSWAFEDQRPRVALENRLRAHEANQGQCGISLAGFDKATGEFVLSTGLDEHEDNPGFYETGYWVAKKAQGQGLATEATIGAIRYAFEHLRAKGISIGYFEGNEPSRRIVEKLGFTKVRMVPGGGTRPLDGAKLDRHEYLMTEPRAMPELEVRWGGGSKG